MNEDTPAPGEHELNAWVDGQLSAERHAAIGRWLGQHSDEAARFGGYQSDRDALRALLQPKFAEPIPFRLDLPPAPRIEMSRHVRPLAYAAAALGLLLLGGVGGYFLPHGRTAPGR